MTETIPQPRVAEEGAFPDPSGAAPGLLVYAPLRFEANAVRRGLTQPGSHVQRTGMGATRSRKSAAQSQSGPFSAMVVMGTAAGLAADLSPGDLVVATEVSDGETTVELPGADLLAAELRRAGLNARAGRIVQVKKIINSSERSRLAADGFMAADMESAALVAVAAAGRPVAVIRAVSDAGFGPGMVTGGMAALRSLRAAAPVAERWAAACRERTVL